MEQGLSIVSAQLTRSLAPMVGSLRVVMLAFAVVRATIRSGFIRQLTAYAAAIVWIGWLASYYKAA